MPKRYPLHTLLLMLAALVAFGRLWCLSHPPKDAPAPPESAPTQPARPPLSPQEIGR